MISRVSMLSSLLLVVFVTGLDSTCFSQEKEQGKDDLNEPRNTRPLPAAPKARIDVAPVQITTKQQLSISIRNGVRSITATEGDNKVEINDNNGKDIVVRQTRTVGGKTDVTETKAADIEALKLKSPDAAELFEKYTKGPAVPGGRIQLPVPVNGRLFPQRPAIFGEDHEQLTFGPRRIRVELEDRKIEISDGADSSIRVKLTRTVEGKELSEEFTGENLRQFKLAHPDVCRYYEKYTGVKAK